MSDGFYLRDETHKTVNGDNVVHKDVLFFKLAKAGFDGKATKDHVKRYPSQFSAFSVTNPSYKLPDHLSDVEIGSPKLSEAKAEVKAEEVKLDKKAK